MKHFILFILAVLTSEISVDSVPQYRPVHHLIHQAVIIEPPSAHVQMAEKITAKYNVSAVLALEVTTVAHKYQHETFPTAADLVAIVGVESRFNPNAKSGLKVDPAIGLTQIRPQAWKHAIKREELNTIDGQIKNGAFILAHYYKVLGNKQAAIQAYNVGLAGYVQHRNPEAASRYLAKYQREIAVYRAGTI